MDRLFSGKFSECMYTLFLSGNNFFVTSETSSWPDANCTLATPEIVLGHPSLTIRNNDILNILPKNQKVWIGFFKAYARFRYIGTFTEV